MIAETEQRFRNECGSAPECASLYLCELKAMCAAGGQMDVFYGYLLQKKRKDKKRLELQPLWAYNLLYISLVIYRTVVNEDEEEGGK